MEQDKSKNQSQRSRITSAIKQMHAGRPFWWRERLENCAEGINAGHTSKHDAASEVTDLLRRLRSDVEEVRNFPDRETQADLKRYLREGIEEVFQFAESHQLPITATMRSLRMDQSSRDR